MNQSKCIVRPLGDSGKTLVGQVVNIHLAAFPGFFLTFMGPGFLKQMYLSYCDHDQSEILVAFDADRPIGFLSYSLDMSGLYKWMIRRRLPFFAWHAFLAFLKKPSVFMHLVRSFLKPTESARAESYIELSSIAVLPEYGSRGVGSALICKLKEVLSCSHAEYISLETDALDNDAANAFYMKNGFKLSRTYKTFEGRLMNEYHFEAARL